MIRPETKPQRSTIREDDIRVKDIERRSFLRRFGILAGSVGLAPAVVGCTGSDSFDSDSGDPIVADNDPSDPIRADTDLGDPVDSD